MASRGGLGVTCYVPSVRYPKNVREIVDLGMGCFAGGFKCSVRLVLASNGSGTPCCPLRPDVALRRLSVGCSRVSNVPILERVAKCMGGRGLFGGELSTYLGRLGPSVAVSALQESVGVVGGVASNDVGLKRVRFGGSGCERLDSGPLPTFLGG